MIAKYDIKIKKKENTGKITIKREPTKTAKRRKKEIKRKKEIIHEIE